jgi:hypothetical protein
MAFPILNSFTDWYWSSKWQAVSFEHNPRYGWRVRWVGRINPLVRPSVVLYRNSLIVSACFQKKIRAGQFCKHPHKLIDFVNSYERKESLQGS